MLNNRKNLRMRMNDQVLQGLSYHEKSHYRLPTIMPSIRNVSTNCTSEGKRQEVIISSASDIFDDDVEV